MHVYFEVMFNEKFAACCMKNFVISRHLIQKLKSAFGRVHLFQYFGDEFLLFS